ncbi:MAG: ribose 5-phosphate isomerase B [Alphaproteobacteria bacterium]|nr:ribose 5-phosphate isomerase B [Alphaproteobacteria bacterium]
MEIIAIACDHGGYDLKEVIKDHYANQFEFLDLGTSSADSVDYPEYGQKLAKAVTEGKAERGIIICGTGIGISISANRFPQIRAANCTNTTMARLTRQHNDANVLALGARIVGIEVVFDIIDTFMNTEFEGGRHSRRIEKMSVPA